MVPVGLTSLIKDQLNSSFLFWLVEGIVRTSIFLGYLLLLSRLRDLRRVFEYHGAEHKTISCYEAGLELTPENAQRFSRLHPRCGTSFLLVVMIVAIFVFAPIGLPAWYWLVLTRIVGVPLIAGISFEIIKFAGRNRRRRWVRAVMFPGLQLQKLTTREPDLDQLAVAIASMEAVLAVEDLRDVSDEDRIGMEVVAVIESLVEQIESRFAELARAMTDPEVIGDRQRYADVGREYARLEGPAKLADEWRRAADDAAGAQELLDEGEDPEVREMLATRARAAWRSSTRRSAWPWSSATRPTTRT